MRSSHLQKSLRRWLINRLLLPKNDGYLSNYEWALLWLVSRSWALERIRYLHLFCLLKLQLQELNQPFKCKHRWTLISFIMLDVYIYFHVFWLVKIGEQAGRSSYVSAEILASIPDPGAMAAAAWYSAAARAVKEHSQWSYGVGALWFDLWFSWSQGSSMYVCFWFLTLMFICKWVCE